MSRTTTLWTAAVAVALAGLGCRSSSEKERQATAEPPPAPAPVTPPEQAAEPPPRVLEEELVGVTETHGATTAAPAAAPAGTANLPPFEGELKVDLKGTAPESLDYAMKGDKIRIGLSSTPGRNDKGVAAIIDTDDQKAIVLLNDRKEFLEVDLGKLGAKAKERVEAVDVERTGKTATVAGRSCEEWKIKDRDYQVTACVMKGAPYFDLAAIEKQAKFTAPAWMHRIVDQGYVPLRVSFSDAAGTSLGTSEITDASRKVEGGQFEIPKGYKKTDASKLTGTMK